MSDSAISVESVDVGASDVGASDSLAARAGGDGGVHAST